MKTTIKPYKISIPQAVLDDLQKRLKNTRWTDEVAGAGWDYGTNEAYLKELVQYWQTDFNWRAQEQKINQFKHYQATINGFKLHFIHEKGKGKNPIPVVLLHGWPSSFLQMQKIMPMLTDPARFGGKADESFDVIVPSLPGYGFSDRPTAKGMTVYQMAEMIATLMQELGYQKYALRGSDIGAGVAKELALTHPERIIGIHSSGSNPYVFQMPENLSAAETQFVQKAQGWLQQEGAYAMQQSSKPQTLAYGLNDSPVGLAAWMVERFRNWSDSDGKVEKRFTKDELLSNIAIYWATQTINSSMRVYYESAHNWSPNGNKRVEVPTAMLMLAKDIAVAPREWENRFYNIVRWTESPKGGHFAEWEEPALTAQDMRAFFYGLKK